MSYQFIPKINNETGEIVGNQPNIIRRISDQASIPFDEGNLDYVLYKEWLDAGNTPAAAE